MVERDIIGKPDRLNLVDLNADFSGYLDDAVPCHLASIQFLHSFYYLNLKYYTNPC